MFQKDSFASGCLCIALSSCSVGPTYTQPTLSERVPDAWHQAVVHHLNQDNATTESWWYTFEDPILIELIIEAEEQNLSLKMATSSLRQARASYGVAAAQFVPDITAKGSAQREQSSDNSPALANFPAVDAKPVNDFSVGLDASWEIDLWGGIEKNVEAASATLEGELEQYRDTLISLRAEVASSYINVRMLQVQRVLTSQYLDTLQQFLELIESQYESGVISKSELEQERAAFDQGSIALPEVEMALQQEYARLAVLVGTNIKPIISKLSSIFPVPRASPNVAVGIPADLIRRRPDIRQAERVLAAQTAIVGAAMSDLYPKLSLSGSFGYEATQTSDLTRWSSRTYGFGPSISWDIFNGDRIKSQVQLEEEKTNEAYLNWELTVLEAFSEVETAMSNLIYSGKVQDSMNDATISLLESLALTQEEFQAGVVQKQSMLQAEQQFINAQITLVEKTSTVSQNLVYLYKALGGDWENGPYPNVQPVPTNSITHVRSQE